MTYSTTRDNEQLAYLRKDIDAFIRRYHSRPAGTKRQTLFLFPGGMGSRLLRATTPYQGDTPYGFRYEEVWLNLDTLFGEALHLKMHEVNGVYQDYQNRIIIPRGAVRFWKYDPYGKFIEWCELNDIDWFIFGWDWRRRLEDTVQFFLHQFLPLFDHLASPTCPNVLQNYALVGHSFGGMVLTLMLQSNASILGNMGKTITVASPFYGYHGQLHCWFEGDDLFNHLDKAEVIKVITSLPGLYVLPYLDKDTFLLNKNALAGDSAYPLATYPSRDRSTGVDVDPFAAGRDRFPGNIGFNRTELTQALSTYRRIARGPDPQYVARFFNIRGVQPSAKTPGSITWNKLEGPDNPRISPIVNRGTVAGDGTQPAWSARLVTLPASQVSTKTVESHMDIMGEDAIQQEIAKILGRAADTRDLPPLPPIEPATRREVLDFIAGLERRRRKGERAIDQNAFRDYVEGHTVRELKSISKRIMMDALKSPTPDAGVGRRRWRRLRRAVLGR